MKKDLLKYQGIMLDVGCGENKQQNFVGLDIRKLPGVDIVHDLEKIPYPLQDNSCLKILASHVVEHINPMKFGFVNVMNEWWRIMKEGGELMIAMPYAWSFGYIQDPTHCNPCNEATFQYFDPKYPLYQIYKPKPWQINPGYPQWQNNGSLNIIMRKIL